MILLVMQSFKRGIYNMLIMGSSPIWTVLPLVTILLRVANNPPIVQPINGIKGRP